MEKRKLGNSDLELSVVGLGTWAIGGPWKMGWGAQDDEDSVRAIQFSLDNGVNWIDTAHVYGFGHSEEVCGRAIKGRRDEVIVATKCGLLKGEGDAVENNLRKQSVLQEIEGSLKRLGVDVIDLYQIHWPNPEEQIEEGWSAIQQAIKEGKIRWGGVSNFSPEQMDRLRPADIVSLQPPYSMLRRKIEERHVPYCRKHDIGIVAYSPMLSGMLTGKVSHERAANLDETDFRRRNKEWQDPNLSANIDFVEKTLRPIADAHDCEPAQVAVAWVLKDKAITSAIVGARNESQALANVKAGKLRLSDDELRTIESGLKARAEKLGEPLIR